MNKLINRLKELLEKKLKENKEKIIIKNSIINDYEFDISNLKKEQEKIKKELENLEKNNQEKENEKKETKYKEEENE